jgi:hypothetical protein
MKKIGLILILVGSLVNSVFAQKLEIGGLDIKLIEEMISDKTGVYYYPQLLKRFLNNDAQLLDIDYKMLYYGQVFQQKYNPYTYFAWEDSLSRLTDQKKGEEAIALADKILQVNPFSLFANIEKAYALKGIGKDSEAETYLRRYNLLAQTIESSGIGNSFENPIYVISPKDAEAIVLRHKLTVISKTINGQDGKYFNIYQVRNPDNNNYPIVFDITLPYTIGMKKLQGN